MSSIEKFKITHLSIGNLVDKIDLGEIALPDIQRPFVWDTTKVRDLIDSLYKGLPIGTIILWEIYKPSNYTHITLFNNQKIPNSLVIDGQQRLTSLYSIIKNKEIISKNVKKIKLKISFNPFSEKFEVLNIAILNDPNWIPDISEIFQDSSYSFIEKFKKRCKRDLDDIITRRIENVLSIKNYSLSVIELNSDLDVQDISDIFIRINSKGKSLNESDFIMTLLSVYSPNERDKIENFCKESYKPSENKASSYNLININPTPSNIIRTITAYSFKRGVLKYIFLMLQGRDLEKKEISEEFRERSFELFKKGVKETLDYKNWHDYIKILHSAGFINPNLISSKINFFITYSFYLIGKYEFKIEDKLLEKLIKRWFIFSQLTQRYTGSPETTIEYDLKNIEDFITFINKEINNNLTSDYWEITLPENLKTSSSVQYAFVTYLASLIKDDIKVLFSEIKLRDHLNPLIKSKKKTIELHHIFPKGYLKKIGINNKSEINQVANLIYIEYKDNIKIFGDKEPSKVWPDALKYYYNDNYKEIFNIYDLPENFWDLSYNEFLEKRKKLMAKRIKDYFYSI